MGKRKPTPKAAWDNDTEAAPGIDTFTHEGFWQEFGPSLEHLRATRAIVVLTLDRATGNVEIDDTYSTPMETWGIMQVMHEQAGNRVDLVNGLMPDE